jgi:hypothetical protein
LARIVDILPMLENDAQVIQMPDSESMSPLSSSKSIQTLYESLGSTVGTVCTSLVYDTHDTPILQWDTSQVISQLVNGNYARHIVWPIVLLVPILSMILYYVFVVVQVDEGVV